MESHKLADNILMCRELDDDVSKEIYFFRMCKDFQLEKGQWIYKFKLENMKSNVSVYQIIDFVEENEKVNAQICELEENEIIRPTQYHVSFRVSEEQTKYMLECTLKQLEQAIKDIFGEWKWMLVQAKLEKIDENRKKYLLNTFGIVSETEFHNRKQSAQMAWYKNFNAFDWNFMFAINLYELESNLEDIIEKNIMITNIDKFALEAKCREEVAHKIRKTFCIEEIKYQIDSPIGVHVYNETKEIVWGYMSPCEIKVEFSFFWTVVKSMLSLVYIPIVVLMLQDKRIKIYMYIFLAMVYLVAIFFSEKDQVEKLAKYKNPITNEEIHYVDLYYGGLILSLTFILFTLQLMQDNSMWIRNLFADIILAFVIVVVFNMCLTLVVCGMILVNSIKDIREKSRCICTKISKLLKTVFWVWSVRCCFYVLDVQQYINEQIEKNIDYKFFAFMFCLMVAITKIAQIWCNREEDYNYKS